MAYLFILFVAIPVAEIGLFITIGARIGLGWTLALVLGTAALGAYLVKDQGSAVIGRVSSAVRAGQFPGVELAHGGLIVFGGALLLTPGFLTDGAGLALMVPSVREAIRVFGARRIGRSGGVFDASERGPL